MNNTTEKAHIAPVQIGNLEVEGLMLPDGSFGISVSQIVKLIPNSITPNNATKYVKRILGKDSPLLQTKSELNSRKINYISTEELEKVILEYALRGDEDAIAFLRIMTGMSLTKFWSDAFGVKFESEQMQNYVKFRAIHKKQFHPKFTSWLKIDETDNYAKEVQRLKAYAGLPSKSVNEYTEDELDLLNDAETRYDAYRRIGISHEKSLKNL